MENLVYWLILIYIILVGGIGLISYILAMIHQTLEEIKEVIKIRNVTYLKGDWYQSPKISKKTVDK
jgi:hypothetical protein